MRLQSLHEATNQVVIRHCGDDDWELGEQADQIAKASGIRISGNKDLTLVAIDKGGTVLGAVWSAFERDHDYDGDVWRYDFDVAVKPEARASGLTTAMIGPRLIAAALQDYRDRRNEVDGASYIRVWVVNPKLAQWLQDRYGFETEGRTYSPDSPHLVYYGD